MAASAHLADLTDALARGRLCIAELAGMSSSELDAVHGMAMARLEVGQDTQAAALLAGLVALFPFSPRYWRAYGVALHRLRGLQEARRAYDAALALEPGHEATAGLRGEVLALLGEVPAALPDLELAARSADRAVARRASELLRRLDAARRTPAPPSKDAAARGHMKAARATVPAAAAAAAPPMAAATAREAAPAAASAAAGTAPTTAAETAPSAAATFVLHDARPLPLAVSRMDTAITAAASATIAVTEVTQPLGQMDPRASHPTPPAIDAGVGAPVERDTVTARIGSRERARRRERWAEVTHTAIVRRGAGDDLEPDEEGA